MTNNCANCGSALPEEAEFCPNCGSKIERSCSCASCGFILPANAVFCPSCGSKVESMQRQNAPDSVPKATGGFVNPLLLPSDGMTPDLETNLFLERESCAFSASNKKFRIGNLVLAALGVIPILVVILLLAANLRGQLNGFSVGGALLVMGACLKFAVNRGRLALVDDPELDIDRANKGEPSAMFNIGVELYRAEITVTRPDQTVLSGPEGAFAYFLDSARSGNVKGIYNVASCIEQGIGCQADKRCALEWYRKAQSAGLYAAAIKVERLSAELSVVTR